MVTCCFLHGLWDLRSPSKDWTLGPWQWEHGVLTTGPPGSSSFLSFKDVVLLSSGLHYFWWEVDIKYLCFSFFFWRKSLYPLPDFKISFLSLLFGTLIMKCLSVVWFGLIWVFCKLKSISLSSGKKKEEESFKWSWTYI